MSHLVGEVEIWATAEWQNKSECTLTFESFSKALKQIFQEVSIGREAANRLVNPRQGGRNTAKYVIEFHTLAAEAGWDDTQ